MKAGKTLIDQIRDGKDTFNRSLPSQEIESIVTDERKLSQIILQHLAAGLCSELTSEKPTEISTVPEQVKAEDSFNDAVTIDNTQQVKEKRITVLLNWGSTTQPDYCSPVEDSETDFHVWVYIENLSSTQKDPVHVIVRRRPPEARMYEGKDSKVCIFFLGLIIIY